MGPPRRAAAISAASNLAATASGSRVVSAAGASSAEQASKGAKSANGAHDKQNAAASSSASKPVSHLPPPPAQPLSPIVSRLRKMWKFAALCQFLLTFDEAFGMSGFDTAALESDLDGTETQVIPDLMRRLLYTLTLNRSIDEDNWEDHLRAQYIRRDPENTILGSIEAPSPWHGLPLTQKVETLHTACEWQLWDAERFRKLVKNEEDAEAWRIESVGWDADENRYWLFDDNRLWVQHPPPPPPPPAKAAPKKSSKKAKAEARREAQLKRKRDSSSAAPPTSTTTAATESTPKRPARVSQVRGTPATRASPRNSSSSGGQAASSSNGGRPAETAYKRARPSRGRQTDEWEVIPASLLYGESTSGGGDEDSDLSDPPEVEEQDESMDVTREGADETIATVGIETEERADEDGEASEMDVDVKVEKKEGEAEAGREDAGDKAVITTPDANGSEEAKDEAKKEEDGVEAVDASAKSDEQPEWVEFETIAVTRAEWEWIATRFAKSKHPDEKALHAYLKGEVVPAVMNDLDELEKQRAHEVAMANRKRSSRIALKESEKEERERDRLARQRMEDKMAAIREEEEAQVRREREEVEATRTREERLREREERLLAREREAIERAHREAEERERRERMREWRKMKREQIIANGGHPPEEDDESVDVDGGEQRLDDDSWELGCDVCGKRGVNLVESEELVCCEVCGVWQHTECWNAFDRRTGRAPRDWEAEDFFCSRCRQPAPGQPYPNLPQQQQQQPRAQESAQLQPQSQPQPVAPVQSQSQLQYQQAPPLQAAPQVQTQATTQSQVPSPAAVPITQSTQAGQQHPPARTLEASARHEGPSSSADTDAAQAASKPQYPSAAAYSSTVHQSPFPPYTTIYGGYGNQGARASPTLTNAAPRSGTSSSLGASSQSPANGASPRSPIPAAQTVAAQSPPSAQEHQQARQMEANSTMAAPLPSSQQATVPNGLPSKSTTLGSIAGGSGVSASPGIVANATEHRVPAPPATSTNQSTTLPAQNGSMSAPSSAPLKPAQSGAQGASSSSAPHNQSNGSTATIPLAPAKVQSMSPKAAPLPVRSPSSGGMAPVSSSLPRNVTKHASGSFPLRHTPVRSPLSGPHGASPNAMPAVALPPPIRSGSPSPAPRSAPQQTVMSGALPPQPAQDAPLEARPAQPPTVPTSSTVVAPSSAPSAPITQPAPVPSSKQLQDPTVSAPVEKQPSATTGTIALETATGSVAQDPSTPSTAAQTHQRQLPL